MLQSVRSARIILFLSILAFIFYLIPFVIIKDVYRYPVVGAIMEMLWLPMLMSLAVLPVLSLIMLARNRNVPWWYPAASLLLVIASVLVIAFKA